MNHSYPLKVKKDERKTIYLPPHFANARFVTYVSFGTLAADCRVEFLPEDAQEIILTEDLFIDLKIPSHGNVHLFIYHDTIHLGPLIGVFTAGFIDSKLRPIGERSLFFAKLLSAREKVGGYAFVFGAHQINWETGTINGLFYEKNGWNQHEVPFPDVIYDRLPNRQIENHDTFKKIKMQLKDKYLIPWFNPGFFNKWEIDQLLRGDETTNRFLPETIAKPNMDLFEQMVEKYHNIYVKPINGSLGHGVFQILFSHENQQYYIRYQDSHQNNRLRRFSSFSKVSNFLHSQIDFEHYLIQQGISLMKWNDKKMDFRVHSNKNHEGIWKVTAIAGKIAGKGSVTTHIHNGGIIKTMEELFTNPTERETLTRQLTEAAISISKVIDAKMSGTIGEIGFDFGIDNHHRIWLFEANSRPGRKIFEHPNLRKYDLMTQQLSMEYAFYLTEQTYHTYEELKS